MAKRKSVNKRGAVPAWADVAGVKSGSPRRDAGELGGGTRWGVDRSRPLISLATAGWLSVGLLAAGLVVAGYWPNDSNSVQSGGARYLAGLLIAAGALAIVTFPFAGREGLGEGANAEAASGRRVGGGCGVLCASDLAAWGLALWMAISSWGVLGDGNARLAWNELWWWFGAAAAYSAAWRGARFCGAAVPWLGVIGAVGAGVAAYGWHQWWIGIPEVLERFRVDPEGVLREAGIGAERGSAQWILFQNRLIDGGPTGTFALANSMSAFLIGAFAVMVSGSACQWRRIGPWRRAAMVAVLAMVLAMIVAARSRSAVASLLLVGLLWWISRWSVRGSRGDSEATGTAGEDAGGGAGLVPGPDGGALSKRAKLLLGSLVIAGFSLVVAWGWGALRGAAEGEQPVASGEVGDNAGGLRDRIGSSEWISQAPASLAFRLRYWKASLRMLIDHPWLGVGPGQFKARYEGYRDEGALEQIVEPHNAFWQVVTTGGIPAGCCLVLLATLAAFAIVRGGNACDVALADSGQVSRRVVGNAAAIGIGSVWVLGMLVGLIPAPVAGMIGTVVAIGYWLVISWGDGEGLSPSGAREAAGWGALAIAIDLMFAGGVTVPGVALPWWVMLGVWVGLTDWGCNGLGRMAAGVSNSAAGDVDKRSAWRWGVAVVASILLAGWYMTAVLPIERGLGAMGRFESAWGAGGESDAVDALRRAAEADRWDPGPTMMLAEIAIQLAVEQPGRRAEWESVWEEAEAETLRRCGDDPVVVRQLADNRLWHYQRYGDRAVLEQGARMYERCVGLAPAHETYAAQLAEIYFELADPRAAEMVSRAERLAGLGGYFERTFPYLRLMPAVRQEPPARERLRSPASEVLGRRRGDGGTRD
jgi:hypothetical protein